MKDVTNMYVLQVRHFAPDIIPYRLIITPRGTNLLRQALGFRDANWNQENFDYVFQDGTLERGANGGLIPITWLAFNDRRIVIQVLGNSDAAHAVYSSVSSMLDELASGFHDAAPLIFNEETSCSARLNFEWTALLSPALLDRVSREVEELSAGGNKRAIKGVSIRFTLGTMATAKSISEYGITPSDQTIAVEPKANVPLSERIYFTYSPCDSSAHLKLVSELEASLSKKARRSRRRASGR